MIIVKFNKKTYRIKENSLTVREFFNENNLIDFNLDYHEDPVVGVLINKDLNSLDCLINLDCELEIVNLFSKSGKRIYRRSLSYLAAYAAYLVYGSRDIIVDHSLGDGYYYAHKDDKEIKNVDKIKDKMQELIDKELNIKQLYFSYDKALNYFKKQNARMSYSLLSYKNNPKIRMYQIQNYFDICSEPLVDNTRIFKVWDLISYDKGMLLRYPRSTDFHNIGNFKDNPLLFKVLRKAQERTKLLGVDCLGELNERCKSTSIKKLIMESEIIMRNNIARIAKKIKDKDSIKTVCIAGPSSSGKTTFSQKLSLELECLGYKVIRISLDNYYLTPDKCPVDKDGKTDFEALEALDLEFLRSQISDLYDKKEVFLPKYDFQILKRTFSKESISLSDNHILVLEGIHALNPNLLPNIDTSSLYKIYISALTQINFDEHNRISTTDTRLLRRMIRDYSHRNASAATTLGMWDSVNRGEKLHIFPHQNNADYMINSALDYELAALASFAKPLLLSVKPKDGFAYVTARRLLSFIDNIYPIESHLVPYDSLLREFIGGSAYSQY